ncbi:MAG: glycosyltransferase family 2 protein [Dehalococcoidia bacterium]|nr:glycosyltransferase family 2 protein [Dehalococcoidia bacterium]
MKIIAVIPCLNEAAFISDVVSKAIKHVDRVFVIDDGSGDRTAEVARQAGAEVIRHGKRRGAGAATRTGFLAALKEGADIVVTLDGDGQHDAAEIPKVTGPLMQGEADLVIGSRFVKPSTNMPPYRNLGIDIITWLYNLGSKDKITDSQSCFRSYSRKLLETVDITRDDFGFSVEVLIKARKKGLKIVEVPASCYYHADSSTMDPITHGLGVAWSVIQLRAAIELCGQKAVL